MSRILQYHTWYSYGYAKWTYNVHIYIHRTYIYIYIYIHRTYESRNTKKTYDFFAQVRNFLLPMSLKVLLHKERDTHSFSSAFFICPPISCDTCWGCPRGVMVKAMNCGIVVREFVLQSRYYVHFRANTLGKGMNPLILPPAMGK